MQIGPGAVIGGGAVIGDHAFIGLGASIRDHVHIGAGAVVGMGSVVIDDVPDGAAVAGVPARAIRTRSKVAVAEQLRKSMVHGGATLQMLCDRSRSGWPRSSSSLMMVIA